MTLMQQQTVRRRQLVDAKQYAVAQAGHFAGGVPDLREHAQPLPVPGAPGEGEALDVPRQADPCRKHDVGVVARGVQPAHASVRQESQIEAHRYYSKHPYPVADVRGQLELFALYGSLESVS